MSDATADQTAADAAGRPGGRRRLVLAAAGLLVALGLGAGLWLGLGHERAALTGSSGAKSADSAAEATALDDFDEMVVNINGTSSTGAPVTRFLKIRLEMVYKSTPDTELQIKGKQPYLRDAVLTYLRQLSEDDLRGSDGLFLLKAELLKRARAVLGNDAPQEFLIGELVMQ